MLINFYKYKKVNHGSPFFISMATNANILAHPINQGD